MALKERTGPTARQEEEMVLAKQHDQEQLCNISRTLAVLASASSVSKERQEFLSLVNKEIKLYNSMLEREDTEGAEEAKKAYMAAREESDDITEVASEEKVLSALIDKVDATLLELEKEIDDVDPQIRNRWQLLDRLPTNWKGQDGGAIIKPPSHQVVECLPGGFPFIPMSHHVQLVNELILQANEDSDDEVALEACDSGLRSVNMQNVAQAGDVRKEQEAAVLVLL